MYSPRRRFAAALCFLIAVPATVAVLSALPQAPQQSQARETVLVLDPDQSKVHWTLGTTLHTVHGTFAFKNGTLQVATSSGKASGEIVVYATRKCTKKFSKAGITQKLSFDRTTLMER
jgi:hypothetical protein